MKTLIAILISMFLAGCDGHVRYLYLQDPNMETPHCTKVLINVDKGVDVPSLIEKVAKKFDLKKDKTNIWLRKEGKESFQITLDRQDDGIWVVALVDWPSFIRSSISKNVEEEIRKELIINPNE